MANKPNRRKPVARARVILAAPTGLPDPLAPVPTATYRLESPFYGGTIEGDYKGDLDALAAYEFREAGLHRIPKPIDLSAPWG